MAFVFTDSTMEPRSFSLGPIKTQFGTYTTLSTDTSATLTFDRIARVNNIVVDGDIQYTAAPTFNGNTVTLAFAATTGGLYGTVMAVGW